MLCTEKEAEFVDNSPSSFLRDGSVNDGYIIQDGIHLPRRATNKLASNMKLRIFVRTLYLEYVEQHKTDITKFRSLRRTD